MSSTQRGRVQIFVLPLPAASVKIPLHLRPWRHRLGVRTSPSHGGNTGSIPVGATIEKTALPQVGMVFQHVARGKKNPKGS